MTIERMQINDRRKVPFCIVETRVLEDGDLSTYDKMIYIALCSFASSRDRECFPAVSTIAKRASCSERQVRVSLGVLEDLGYIQRTFVTGGSTVYTLLDLDERAASRAGEGGTTCRGGRHPMPGGAAQYAGEGGTTCRGERHSVPPNKKYLTRTKEQDQELEKDTQPMVEAAPENPAPKILPGNPQILPQMSATHPENLGPV
jgi:hypothetical protein